MVTIGGDLQKKAYPTPGYIGYKGYKDGLQPESLADGNWLVKQKQPVSKIETNLTQTWEVCMSLDSGMHWTQNQWYWDDKPRKE